MRRLNKLLTETLERATTSKELDELDNLLQALGTRVRALRELKGLEEEQEV